MTQHRDGSYPRAVEIRHRATRMVLVVEDNENSRGALTEALQTARYDVVAVENGLEALDHLRWSWRPDCVVLDMRMPVMTGWELREAMKADPMLRDIPVIGMTGGRWKPDDARGFVCLMAKPINFDELRDSLDAVVARAAPRTGLPPSATWSLDGKVFP